MRDEAPDACTETASRSASLSAKDFSAKVDALPTQPGVYLFKSDRGAVLYVGKAQSLRSRVRQYLAGGDGRAQIPALMARAVDVDVLVTANVKEALLLEKAIDEGLQKIPR